VSDVSALREKGFSVHEYDDGSFLVNKPGVLFGIIVHSHYELTVLHCGVEAGKALALEGAVECETNDWGTGPAMAPLLHAVKQAWPEGQTKARFLVLPLEGESE
jgi:hypothetical protein